MSNQPLDREIKMAELQHINAETAKLQAETARITMEAEQLRATTLKLQAEADKIQKETKFYPYVVAGGLGGLVGAIVSIIFKVA